MENGYPFAPRNVRVPGMKKLLVFVSVYPLIALLSLRVGAVLTGFSGIATFFGGAHPVLVVVTLATGFALGSYLLGAITGDYSWVDRLWSTAPIAFAWVYAVRSSLAFAPTIAAILVTVWGLRLSYNFARRGGYTTMEDYRWPILRERIGNAVLWQLFNLLFISGFQVSLFVLFTAPVHRLATLDVALAPITVAAAAIAFVVMLAVETIADQQQWTFQNIKHGELAADEPPGWFAVGTGDASIGLREDLERGFLTHGLFHYSRHPNYFGELGVWWAVYLFAAVAAGGLIHWTGAGAVLLTALFVGSTRFTESISANRYPRYTEYQERTSAVVPWPPAPPTEQEQVD